MDLYEPLEVIGSGAFGKVSKIRRKADGRLLVWKELNYGGMSEREKQQLVAEVNIIRELRSPFIVRYYDRIVDKEASKIFIVMEYCGGGDLGHVIKKCKRNRTNLEESIIWKIVAQLVIALNDCHNRENKGECRPILHRDIKPANILLDDSKNIKLGDFGLAKELASAGKLAQTHVGTPFYMSPELISGKAYDEKSDIWAMGCLIYELAALRPPFNAHNELELAMKIKDGKYPRIPSKYSSQLNSVISACLQVDPNKRPRLVDLENMQTVPKLKDAIADASYISKEYSSYVSYSEKSNGLKEKEEALMKLESELKNRELALAAAEEALSVRRRELDEREKIIARKEEDMNSRVSYPTDQFEQVYADMEVEPIPSGQRMSLCAEPDNTSTSSVQPPFKIYHDPNISRPPQLRRESSYERRPREVSSENVNAEFSKRSPRYKRILARASALTKHRVPPPVPRSNSSDDVFLAKRLLAETPILGSEVSNGDNEVAIYKSNGNTNSASKRRRRSDFDRPPPPPSKGFQEKSVPSVQVDLRNLLPYKSYDTAQRTSDSGSNNQQSGKYTVHGRISSKRGSEILRIK